MSEKNLQACVAIEGSEQPPHPYDFSASQRMGFGQGGKFQNKMC